MTLSQDFHLKPKQETSLNNLCHITSLQQHFIRLSFAVKQNKYLHKFVISPLHRRLSLESFVKLIPPETRRLLIYFKSTLELLTLLLLATIHTGILGPNLRYSPAVDVQRE